MGKIMKKYVIKNKDGSQQHVMPAVHDTRKKAEETLMGKELIAKAYRDSFISGQEYERVVKYVEEIKKGSKPSLWRRILFNLTKLCNLQTI